MGEAAPQDSPATQASTSKDIQMGEGTPVGQGTQLGEGSQLGEGTQRGEGTQSPASDKDKEAAQAWPDDQSPTGSSGQKGAEVLDQPKRKSAKGGYDFQCGQVMMATPYGQMQLVRQGCKPEEIRQALGFSPEFMAGCFRAALAAQPLNKGFQPFQSKEDYQIKMHAMVSRDQIPRLGDGWMLWAKQQANDWEQMLAQSQQAQADERAAQARLQQP